MTLMVFLQPLNAPFFTEIFFRKVNFLNALQFLNAFCLIFVVPRAAMEVSFLQPLKAFGEMLLILVPKVALASLAEFLNAPLPISVTW